MGAVLILRPSPCLALAPLTVNSCGSRKRTARLERSDRMSVGSIQDLAALAPASEGIRVELVRRIFAGPNAPVLLTHPAR